MARILLFLSIFIVLSAIGFYQLIPPFPDGLENVNFLRKFYGVLTTVIFKAAVTAESFGLIGDSAIAVRGIMSKMTAVNYTALRLPEIDFTTQIIADVPVLIFRKSANSQTGRLPGALVYFHGGGFVLRSAWDLFRWTQQLAVETDALVFSVEYRLAPEFPCCAAIDDAIKVTKAVFDSAEKFQIDPSRIMVGGDSAGGNFAAVVAIELAGSKKYPLKAQLLLSPAVQAVDMLSLPSYKLYGPSFIFPIPWFIAKYAAIPYSWSIHSQIMANQFVTRDDMLRFGRFLNVSNLSNDLKSLVTDHSFDNSSKSGLEITQDKVPNEALAIVRKLATDQRAWPLQIEDDSTLAKVAPALLSIAEFDPLRDEELLYFDRLRSLGVKVTLSFLPKASHVEPSMTVAMNAPPTTASKKGLVDVVNFIKENL